MEKQKTKASKKWYEDEEISRDRIISGIRSGRIFERKNKKVENECKYTLKDLLTVTEVISLWSPYNKMVKSMLWNERKRLMKVKQKSKEVKGERS